MTPTQPDALIGWALTKSKTLTVKLFPKLPCAVLLINDTPELSFLVRTAMPLSNEVRLVILEAFFQENQPIMDPEDAAGNGELTHA